MLKDRIQMQTPSPNIKNKTKGVTETLNKQEVTEVGAGGKLNTAENNQGNVQWSKTKYNTQKTTNYQKSTTKTGSENCK